MLIHCSLSSSLFVILEKTLHLLHVVRKTLILQCVGYILRRTQSHNRVLLHRTLLYEQKMKQG